MTPPKKSSKAVKKSTKKKTTKKTTKKLSKKDVKKPAKSSTKKVIKESVKKKTSKKTTKKISKKTSTKKTTKSVVKKPSTAKTSKAVVKKGVSKTSSKKQVQKPKNQTKKVKKEEKEEKAEKELTEEEKTQKEEEEKEKKLRYDSFKKAGEIHKQVIKFIKPKVKIGAKLLDICEQTESKLIELGGEIGFPTNVCINEIAAHYSSPPNDESVIKEGDVVKVDIGVSVEGYVADGAFSVSFNQDPATANLVTAVETAVMKGLSIIKPGVKTIEVGKTTAKIIRGFGYNPIKDLRGHSLEKWQVHGFKSIPSVGISSGDVFEEGDVFALECFASTGLGNIHNGTNCNIYEYDLNSERVPIRMKITRQVIGWIANIKKTLPFSTRELLKEFRTGKMALRELTTAGKLHKHYELREQKGAYVSQFEKTFIVTEDGIEIFN
ncbi:type II methionyl aminopeptidase [Promethearchaeum syntrophicum]|uniref:Methionine aminopeptidase n=1 Tax=Promethearchaeum syntrophicum TaxID=2594042 RepID=A0A5B9DBZ5_9ARCH